MISLLTILLLVSTSSVASTVHEAKPALDPGNEGFKHNPNPPAAIFDCKSRDYDVSRGTGQFLQLRINHSNLLVSITNLADTSHCETREILNPRLILTGINANLYDANFGCSEWNGRLSVPNTKPLVRVNYSYSSSFDSTLATPSDGDHGYRRMTYDLDCTHSSQ